MTPFRAGVFAGMVLALSLVGATAAAVALARRPSEKRMAVLCGAALVAIGLAAALFPEITCSGAR